MPTRSSGLRAVRLSALDVRTVAGTSHPDRSVPVQSGQLSGTQAATDYTTIPDQSDEEEEEKRRRAALLGVALPLLGDVQFPVEHVPMVQGTPQFGNALVVRGTPQLANTPPPTTTPTPPPSHGPIGSHTGPAVHGDMPPAQPPHHQWILTHHAPAVHRPSGSPHPKHPSPAPRPPTPGCAVWLIILIIPALILAGTFAVGATLLTPALSLSGSSGVALGGSLQLHGRNFIPASPITLTLDGTIPLYYTYQHTLLQVSHRPNSRIGAWTAAKAATQLQFPTASNMLIVGGDGTFDVTIVANQNWGAGKHTIRASEQFTPRSAMLWFTAYQPAVTPSATATPIVTPTATPTPNGTAGPTVTASSTPKPTSTPSPTPTTTSPGLSGINPGTVTLGPVSDGHTQTVSAQVILTTAGSALIQWNATWNQDSASWLQLDRTGGQIQAPNAQPITVRAITKGLSAGTYSTTVTFTSSQSSKNVTLTVSLIVQAGCVSVTPHTLNFTGTMGTSDPSLQTVTVNNCGAEGTWSASATTDTGVNWLSISPASGNLQGETTQQVTVTASVVNTQLGTGTYQGKLLFTKGSGQFVVHVTLTVQSPPVLNVSLTTISASKNCTFNQSGYWVCFETLSSSQNTQVNLNWTSSSSGFQGITISPASGTLSPGQTVQVEIDVPRIPCDTTATLTFTGPANILNVPVSC